MAVSTVIEDGCQTPPDAGACLHLVVMGENLTVTHRLRPGTCVLIGRAEEAAVRLLDPQASRRHACLHVGVEVELEDLGSANGTRLRDQVVAPRRRHRLTPGDAVSIGATLMTLQRREPRRVAAPTAPTAPVAGPTDMVLCNRAMHELYRLAERVAPTNINVLITGETGAGKDVLAQTIHRRSARADHPFLSINCAALSDTLLESELFGHEKGAFTGADRARAGLLESAQGGTVFLDEIGEMSVGLQAKLLRAIESKKVLRVGSTRPVSIDVRFLAATNQDVEEEVASNNFRADLYFRLNGVTLTVPPLRARPDEIEPLARHFLASAAARSGGVPPAIDAAVLDLLRAHPWPGNIRELRNLVERSLVLCDGDRLGVDNFAFDRMRAPPAPLRPRDSGVPWRERLGASERDAILDALSRCAGNQTRAAELLGMPRRTFCLRLKQFSINRPRVLASG